LCPNGPRQTQRVLNRRQDILTSKNMKTQEIVLSIFGGERCVTTHEDLEEIAKAIHSKAVRESETSVNPSTLAGKIEGQISPINEPHAADEEANPILVEVNEHARYVFHFTAEALAAAKAQYGSIENWFTSLENPVMQADEFVIENRTVSIGGLRE